MNKKDLFGKSIYDYWFKNDQEDLITYTHITEPETLPVDYLFRYFDEMPLPEQEALLLAKGKILDVGAGSGTHSIWLQKKGLDVLALDFSEYNVKVMKDRGIKKTIQTNFFSFESPQKFDTILFLMNGIGIVEKAIYTDRLFKKLDELLAPDGIALIHTSDLKYLYEETGGYLMPKEGYYGDVKFTIEYKGDTESFNWTYIDEQSLQFFAQQNNYQAKKISESEYGDFLMKVWKNQV